MIFLPPKKRHQSAIARWRNGTIVNYPWSHKPNLYVCMEGMKKGKMYFFQLKKWSFKESVNIYMEVEY